MTPAPVFSPHAGAAVGGDPTSRVPSLRVLFLDLEFRRVGGLETFNLDTVRALRRLGVDVTVWSCFTAGARTIEGIPVVGLAPTSRSASGLYRRCWRTMLRLRLSRLPESPDLLIVGHVFLVRPVVLWARRRRVPCWLLVFGVDIWNPLPRRFQRAVERVDRIVAVSRYTAERAGEMLPAVRPRLTVIRPAVDTERFRPGTVAAPSENRVIVTVARLSSGERYKGHDLVIRALPRVLAALKGACEYWVVGEGDDRPRLESLAVAVGVASAVRFLGRLPDADLVDCYRRCDVFAMPSWAGVRSDGFRTGEGFGIVYLEAAACGKPVLAATLGGQAEAVKHGETGLLVEPTTEAVAGGLIRLLTDSRLAHRLGANGRRLVEETFTFDHFDARWRELIDTVQLARR